MKFQLSGEALYEVSCDACNLNPGELQPVKVRIEFEEKTLNRAIALAKRKLCAAGYVTIENDVLKLKDPWKRCTVELQELKLKPLALFEFLPEVPEIAEPRRVIQPGLPARIEVRKL
jgi:hypothetical protein